MTLLLILFFISLVGIIIMVGSKLILQKSGQIETPVEFKVEVPDIEDVKHIAVYGVKRFGYIALVKTIRFSLLSSKVLKEVGKEGKNKIVTLVNKYSKQEAGPKEKEVSKFLSLISDYKHKINNITNKIKKEEGID